MLLPWRGICIRLHSESHSLRAKAVAFYTSKILSRLCQVVPSMGFVIPPSAPDMKSALKLPLIIVGLYVMAAKMTAPKPYRGPGAKKGRFSSTFLKGTMEGKWSAPKSEKIAGKPPPRWCSHSHTIYDAQVQQTIDNSITHAAATPRNPDTATTICIAQCQTRMSLRTWQHNRTAIMQPFQCNLQPNIPQAHRNYAHTNRPKAPAPWSDR